MTITAMNLLALLSIVLIGQLVLGTVQLWLRSTNRRAVFFLASFHLALAGYLLYPAVAAQIFPWSSFMMYAVLGFSIPTAFLGASLYAFYLSVSGRRLADRPVLTGLAGLSVLLSLAFHAKVVWTGVTIDWTAAVVDGQGLLIQVPLLLVTLVLIRRDIRADLVERSRRERSVLALIITLSFLLLYVVYLGLVGHEILAGRYLQADKLHPMFGYLYWSNAAFAVFYSVAVAPFLLTRRGRLVIDDLERGPRAASTLPADPATNGGDSDAADEAIAIDPAVLQRLLQLMEVDKAYRDARLTMGALAAQMELTEKELRALINQGLGFRNFNHFLNSYRVAEAKQWLADPARSRLPVLTIALDLGFGSAASFNRVFKAATDQTPTDFREGSSGASTGAAVAARAAA